jgi:hypothetical protein
LPNARRIFRTSSGDVVARECGIVNVANIGDRIAAIAPSYRASRFALTIRAQTGHHLFLHRVTVS